MTNFIRFSGTVVAFVIAIFATSSMFGCAEVLEEDFIADVEHEPESDLGLLEIEICDGVDNDGDGETDESHYWNEVGGLCAAVYEEGSPFVAGEYLCYCGTGECEIFCEPACRTEEICFNSLDDNCDGEVNEGCDCITERLLADADGDGYGNPNIYVSRCDWYVGEAPSPGYVRAVDGRNDCDDSDPGVHPDAIELCDGVDNNCDGLVDDDC